MRKLTKIREAAERLETARGQKFGDLVLDVIDKEDARTIEMLDRTGGIVFGTVIKTFSDGRVTATHYEPGHDPEDPGGVHCPEFDSERSKNSLRPGAILRSLKLAARLQQEEPPALAATQPLEAPADNVTMA